MNQHERREQEVISGESVKEIDRTIKGLCVKTRELLDYDSVEHLDACSKLGEAIAKLAEVIKEEE